MAQAREQWAEAGVGALVLAAAAAFLVYALGHTGGSGQRGGYSLLARFGEAGSLTPGAAPEDLKPGAEFANTQGAVDLFGLIGQAIRPAPSPSSPAASDPYPAAP